MSGEEGETEEEELRGQRKRTAGKPGQRKTEKVMLGLDVLLKTHTDTHAAEIRSDRPERQQKRESLRRRGRAHDQRRSLDRMEEGARKNLSAKVFFLHNKLTQLAVKTQVERVLWLLPLPLIPLRLSGRVGASATRLARASA